MALSPKAQSWLIKVLNQATPFKSFAEINTDVIVGILIRQFDNLVLDQFIKEEYNNEVDRFVFALESKDIEAARQEFETLSELVPIIPFFKSENANRLFCGGIIDLLRSSIEEFAYRQKNPD